MKKPWEKPLLVVLVRSKPQEAVLNGCKVADQGAIFPADTVTGCHEAT
jgi:hypothetical protein